jgi:hypothetical protein
MHLQFDPAIAAHKAFEQALESNELGVDSDRAAEWAETFADSAGDEPTQAYRQLLALGQRYPTARAFQEFLIYSTWQQAAEDPIAEHFQRGLTLCDDYLAAATNAEGRSLAQVRALRASFQNALGAKEHDEVGDEFDRDAFKGGD